MSVVVDINTRRAPGHAAARPPRPDMLDQLAAMGDATEIAEEQLAAGRRPVDVYADLFRAGLTYAAAHLDEPGHADPQVQRALALLDQPRPGGGAA